MGKIPKEKISGFFFTMKKAQNDQDIKFDILPLSIQSKTVTKRIELQPSGWTHLKEDKKSFKLVIRGLTFYDHKNKKYDF